MNKAMEEKVQQIIEYLSKQGFEIPDFETAYQKAASQFSVEYYKSFGDDSMKYNLKFSWDHQFQNYRWDGYKATYYSKNGQDRSQSFTASYVGIAHANLAYHVLSGRLEDIRDRLMESGLEQYTSIDINGFLERILCQNPDTFTFHAYKNDKEGLIDFDINVTMVDQYYEASTVRVTFTPFPDIKHGVFNGVDTEKLEVEMAEINWEDDGLYELGDDDIPLPSPEVMDILDKMELLLQDEKGKDAAFNLQLRHWLEAPYFEAHVLKDTWQLYERLPKQDFTFPLETGAYKIYNMMCGRPAIVSRLTDVEHNNNTWNRLTTKSTGLELTKVVGPSRREIDTFLSMLPVDDMDKPRILTCLLRGDICTTTLHGLEPMQVNISVDLTAKALKITTLDGQAIPYNFRLEPQKQQQPPNIHPGKWQQRSSKKNKKRKGRGL